MASIRCGLSARNAKAEWHALANLEYVLGVDAVMHRTRMQQQRHARAAAWRQQCLRIGVGVESAAFEEFVEIWQRLFTHPNCAIYFQRACFLCRRH